MPGAGASMTTAATSARMRPSRPVARPLASQAASRTINVYVIAPAMWTTLGPSPRTASIRAYWTSSVG